MIPDKKTTVIATNATAVGLKSKAIAGKKYPIEGHAQPRRARMNTTAKIFSDIFIAPNFARPSSANFLLSIFTASGRSIQ